MKTRKVVVLPYDERWKTEFEVIKGELQNGVADKMDIRNLREYLIGAKQIALADVNNDGASNICDLVATIKTINNRK